MKYGFVYIWRDRKHNRYYVGCHWGHINDGYVCSSTWMRNAYKRRCKDFKRRILATNLPDRISTLEEEYKWLQLIQPNELRTKYYNMHNSRGFIFKNLDALKRSENTQIKPNTRHSPNTEFKKGLIPHNKGLTLKERYGDQAELIISKMSKAKKGISTTRPSHFTTERCKGSANVNARRISTPHGTYDTIVEASLALNIPRVTIDRRLNSVKQTEWIRL